MKKNNILGIDEAGRGPLAGPVVVAGVIFSKSYKFEGLRDSKKLSASKRAKLFSEITQNALAYHIVEIDAVTIDKLNILQATLLGMKNVADYLAGKYNEILVDGNTLPDWDYKSKAIIKGDSFIDEISAASIIAKVHRDNIMAKYDEEYPCYEFGKHKGYPTKNHIKLIEKHGICIYHRKSFKPIKNFLVGNI